MSRTTVIGHDPLRRLDARSLLRGVAHLSRVDPDLAAIVRRHGTPPLWARRPGIWPTGDLALLTALQHARQLPRRPSVEEAAEHARRWTPWRAVAARILWSGYLAGSLTGAGRRAAAPG